MRAFALRAIEALPLAVFLIYMAVMNPQAQVEWRAPYYAATALALAGTVLLWRKGAILNRIYLGGSPRAGIALMRVAKARAIARGREYLLPDDVKEVAAHVLAHRLILAPESRSSGLSGEDVVGEVVEKTPVPV